MGFLWYNIGRMRGKSEKERFKVMSSHLVTVSSYYVHKNLLFGRLSEEDLNTEDLITPFM